MIHKLLSPTQPLSSLALEKGILSWAQLLDYLRKLPYGRNSNRFDFSLVLKEEKGSCSSKHALLKLIADENNISKVKLMLVFYKMNQWNTPGIGSLKKYGLDYIPEAHCYLEVSSEKVDVTTANSKFERFQDDILTKREIKPDQVVQDKVQWHKDYIKSWLVSEKLDYQLNQIWKIRENCIQNLTTM